MNAKRILALILSLCMMLTVASFPVMAATGTTDDGLKYSIEYDYGTMQDAATITGYLGYPTEIIIPEKIEGYPVTSIGSSAFSSCTYLESITIPNSVTWIGGYAFEDCSSLKSITIPDSVTTIREWAFYNCTALTSIAIPSSVTSVSSVAFQGATSLASIDVSEQNPYYSSQDGILFNKNKTTIVLCPEGKTATTYIVPDTVTEIADGAFYCYKALEKIVIPDTVTTIGAWAFAGCSSLTSITLPDNITTIGERTFAACKSLTSITIPDNLTSIGGHAFYNCSSLTDIVIPDKVVLIGDSAFSSCKALSSITLGDSVKTLGEGIFSSCTSLENIVVNQNNKYYSTHQGVLYNKAKTILRRCPAGKSGNVTVVDGTTMILDSAFAGCSSITSVEIPDSVTSIGASAFDSCYSLNDVYYAGTQAQKEQIAIGSDNSYLTDATWHYETVPDCDHIYDNDCDSECNKCGTLRTVVHSYDNACDAECNLCKAIREVGNHKYDSVCDADCNECGAKRAVTHTYINACDLDCNVCGHVRPVNNHVYDNRCDADCNVCGAIQKVGNHYYTNDSDTTCNECGYTRGNTDNAPAFIIEDRIAKVGDTFTVAVSTKNNVGIVSLKLNVGYDAEVLELVSIEEADFADTTFSAVGKNPISVLWEDVLSDNNTTNGTVALLTFKVKDTASAGTTEITITYDPEDVYDYDMNNVDFAVENGTITVIEYISGDVNGDGNVNNKDYGILRQYLNNWEVNIDEHAADVNRDGTVNNKDLGILRRYLNNWDVELK